MIRRAWILFLLPLLAAGCGGGSHAPVSGKVTLDNKPLANAAITFQPVASQGSEAAGLSSSAITDANGQFTLKCADGKAGAVVGKHRVSITTLAVGADDSDAGGKARELVPRRYNVETTLEFEVKSGGHSDANFDLKSP